MPGNRYLNGIDPILLQAGNLFLPAAVFGVNLDKQDRPPFLVVEHHVRPGQQPAPALLVIKLVIRFTRLDDKFCVLADVNIALPHGKSGFDLPGQGQPRHLAYVALRRGGIDRGHHYPPTGHQQLLGFGMSVGLVAEGAGPFGIHDLVREVGLHQMTVPGLGNERLVAMLAPVGTTWYSRRNVHFLALLVKGIVTLYGGHVKKRLRPSFR